MRILLALVVAVFSTSCEKKIREARPAPAPAVPLAPSQGVQPLS